MFEVWQLALAVCMMVGAALYTSVGHAGASSYIAMMALFSVPALTMRPTALVLNIIVALFTSYRFIAAGHINWKLVTPLVLGSVPAAFLGGYIHLPTHIFKILLGVMLLLSAARLLYSPLNDATKLNHVNKPMLFGLGSAIGLLSGLTGTGGGIFLSPVALFFSWEKVKTISGIAAVFILFNSTAGLLGNITSVNALPKELPLYIVAVLIGAVAGTTLGIRVSIGILNKLLASVLVIAGLKLVGVY
jgi:uncharacterized membrane protein YfcA